MKKLVFPIILSLLIFLITAPAISETRGIKVIKDLSHRSGKLGAYRALIIGINDYKDPKIPDLETAVKDAKAMAELLQERYGFKVNLLLNQNATREVIYRALRKLAISTKSDDSVLIYFAGHGDLDRTYDDGWWIPSDAEGGNPVTYLDNIQVQKSMRSMKARHVLLISDSCYSGTLFGQTRGLPKVISEKYYLNLYNEKSRWGMTSGNKTPVADDGTRGHSIFAYQLLKELRNNEKPYITTQELYTRIAPVVSNNSEQTPLCRPIRNTGDQGGEFVFVVSTGSVPAPKKDDSVLSAERQRLEQERKELERIKAEIDERKRIEAERKRIEAEKKKLLEKDTPKVASVSPAIMDAKVVARDGHYEKYANDIVKDTRTGLEWYVGPDKDTTENEAKSWVESLKVDGGGWRMPTRDDVETLYEKGVGKRNMTPLLKISGWSVWYVDKKYSSSGWYLYFNFGEDFGFITRSDSYGKRVFAVRSRR